MSAKLHHLGRISTLWDNLRTSFWFVPSLMVLGALALTAAALAVDARLTARPGQTPPWWVYVSDPDDARDVLSTLLASMITMVSLVFSITMVVLTLAANQFGPRLIRNFMASPQTQVVLGTFVMTIVYCLLVLPSIGRRSGTMQVPFSTVSVAIVLALVSVGLLVLFLHTLARSIVSETVIERVGRELDGILDGLDPLPTQAPADPAAALPDDFESRAAVFGPSTSGYVQAIEFNQLLDAATAADVVVGVYFRAGDYVVKGGRGIAIYPRERFSQDLADAIERAVLVGSHRTPAQDPEFPIRHLVEIAVRALSPGINDPYTAVSVVHQLSSSLSRLMRRALPAGVFLDGSGVVRVVCPRPTYQSLIGAAFDQIRQNGADKPLVAIHLLGAIERIGEHTQTPVQGDALREQLRIIGEAAARRIEDPSDQSDVAKRLDAARRALGRA